MTWRGVVRWSVRGVAGLVVLLLLWLLVGRIHAARRLEAARETFTQNVGPLDLSAWASPPVPDTENAAIPIRAGVLGLVLSQQDRPLVGELTRNPTIPMTPDQVDTLRSILVANRTALELIAQGARLERSNFGEDLHPGPLGLDGNKRSDPSMVPKSRAPLVECMTAGRLLRARARLAALDGDREQVLGSLESVFGLARALHQEPLTIHQLIASAIERIGLGETISVALAAETTPAELERLHRMQLDNDLRAHWTRVMATEALISINTVRQILREEGNAYRLGVWERLRSAMSSGMETAIFLELCRDSIALYDQPAGLREPPLEQPARSLRLRWFLLGLVSPLDAIKEIMKAIGGENRKASARLQATAAQRTFARLILDVRLAALRSGAYPSDLSELPAAAVPDPFTGKQPVYERKPDGSALLSMPDGEALWKQVTNGMPTPCPFTVTLPPPASPTSRGSS